MADPTLLYCVGATKAGTSALYRYLHDHDACKLPPVKEAHYWDTFDPAIREKQIIAYRDRLSELHVMRDDAKAAGLGWKVANMERRIASMRGLIAVLGGDRDGDLAYAAWLLDGAEHARLVADMTPNYALVDDATLQRMADLSATTRFIYLMRDPIDRLWSHIRMQARRFRQDGEVYAKKANNILWRVVNAGQETHLMARGDYAATVARLRRIVPEGRLFLGFAETLFTVDGLTRLCEFLGIPYQPSDAKRVHEGEAVKMRDDLRPKVADFLKEQYDWVAMNVAPLPDHWQHSLKRAYA
ncbi:Sulfotransferase family protein [Cognatiyoonia koreensis]|uniref:Sulfotransferase family protein n=1 Tax=Cognatiyoonia koreensis TaxID=364200 RepID=A0A1I0NKJ3_9RHOB|nr:sulfotransferase [Cognatiyoonia koreensis]SEW01791.1 Sulfotransferase family protein [Cognatiyoonia koreensis]